MRSLLILSVIFFFLRLTTVIGQESKQTIGDELKSIWEDQKASDIINMDGVYDTQVWIENTTDIDFGTDTFDTPIDGGLGFLLAAGVGYYTNGVRKRRRKKDQNDSEIKGSDK